MGRKRTILFGPLGMAYRCLDGVVRRHDHHRHLFVGHLGAASLAGVGLAGVTAFTLLAFCFGLLRGIKVLVSQARGAGVANRANGPILAAGLLFALVMGALATLVGLAIADILPRVADSAGAGTAARDYLAIRVLASPLALSFAAFRESCYGLGKTTIPMRASLVANVVNVVLDAWFIVGLDWGVRGAALASVVATATELTLIVWVGPRLLWADVRRSVDWVGRLIRVGAPTGFQFLIELSSFTLLTFLISSFADMEMAAHQIALQVIHFGFLPAVAIGEAASIMAGEAVGASRDRLVRVVAGKAMWIGGAYMVLFTIVLALFALPIAGAFTSDWDVASRAVIILYIGAGFQLGDAANIVARCVLRGTGDVFFPAVIGIGLAWLLTPTSFYFFGIHMGMGAVGGWIGISAEVLIGTLIFWHRLICGGWHRSAERSRADVNRSEITT